MTPEFIKILAATRVNPARELSEPPPISARVNSSSTGEPGPPCGGEKGLRVAPAHRRSLGHDAGDRPGPALAGRAAGLFEDRADDGFAGEYNQVLVGGSQRAAGS